ncbi:MAG: hypothetical protein NW241_04415 [Bacteroidia bacterium]|nr:hypothetical protein [Bacteroidia bacterium]
MKFRLLPLLCAAALLAAQGCTQENDGVILPMDYADFPQILAFDDEESGDLEDSDEAGFVLKLLDRIDPDGEELGGRIVPLDAGVTVEFEVEAEGFSNLADYLLGWEAFYEVDDCTTSSDLNIDLGLAFDPATGRGSVTFPAEVEEIEVVFELNDALFDDDVQNGDARGFAVTLTGTSSGQVLVNPEAGFEYLALDDELIFGGWELDLALPGNFEALQALLGLVNEDAAALAAADLDKAEIEFGLLEAVFKLELTETETVEECGEIETVPVEIEVETEYESLTDDATEGELELIGEVEDDAGRVTEFVFAGSFRIEGGQLILTLDAEYDDETREGLVLTFVR